VDPASNAALLGIRRLPDRHGLVKKFVAFRRIAVVIFLLLSWQFELGDRAGAFISASPSADGYRFLGLDPDTMEPVRFDPCNAIHYVINRDLAPARGVKDVHEAAAKTAKATGIEFVFDGFTDELPAETRDIYQPERYGDRWAPILVAWQPGEYDPDDVHTVGLAYPRTHENSAGRLVLVSGQMVLNSSETLSSGFVGWTWGKVILHEFGHLVGLEHVADETQIMNAQLEPMPVTWNSGDLAGLRLLGAEAGCLEVPAPG
jgi:hypothetical protein